MAISYDLMDLDSGNLVGSYPTLSEALTIVRKSYVLYGWSRASDMGLVKVGHRDAQEVVALGPELARLAIAEGNSLDNVLERERTA